MALVTSTEMFKKAYDGGYGFGVPQVLQVEKTAADLPLLVLGAVTGGVYSRLLENLLGIDGKYIAAFVVLAMAGYFAAIVHAPVTGEVLFLSNHGDD